MDARVRRSFFPPTVSCDQEILITHRLSYLNANGATDPNGAIGNQGAQLLLANITDAISTLQALNLPKQIPVGTSDAGAYFNNMVLQAVDYGVRVPFLGYDT